VAGVASDTPSIQVLFSCRLARYLGRISFALYLVHGICIHVIALWLVPTMWKVTGKGTKLRFELGFFLAASVHVPITLLAASLFTKAFDNTSVRFAKWIEVKLTVNGTETRYQSLAASELPLTESVVSPSPNNGDIDISSSVLPLV
jgi:peptidoglycan/LPS O-acetylase OafA/YrhL